MTLRSAFLALLLAPGAVSAQLVNPDSTLIPGTDPPEYLPAGEPIYPQLDIVSPDHLAATVSNFRPYLLPTPPYTMPDTLAPRLIGASAFIRVVEGDSIPQGAFYSLGGVTATFALALNADGDLAYGCDGSAPDGGPSDIANGASFTNKIVLIQRGPAGPDLAPCSFFLKAQRVGEAGGIAFVVYNDPDRNPDHAPNMPGGQDVQTPVYITGAAIPWVIAETLVTELLSGGTITGTLRCDEAYESSRHQCRPGFEPGVEGTSEGERGLVLVGENPTRTAVHLIVRTPAAENVTVVAYDGFGREVAVLFRGAVVGERAVTLQAAGLPSGTYFVRAVGETFAETRQVTVVR